MDVGWGFSQHALGFGADSVALVERLRCFGCPREPFTTMKIVEATRTQHVYGRVVNHDTYQEFEWVAVEQKFDAPAIETRDVEGWAFWELDKIEVEKPQPVVLKKDVASDAIKVPKGHNAGSVQYAYGIVKGKKLITMDFKAYIGAPEEFDSVTIKGVPPIKGPSVLPK